MTLTDKQKTELGEIRNVLHTVRFLIEEMKNAQVDYRYDVNETRYIVSWNNKVLGGNAVTILTKLYYAVITRQNIRLGPSVQEQDPLYLEIEERVHAARDT